MVQARPLDRSLRELRCGRFRLLIGARTLVMGIINVTPDSFSGDGLGPDPEAALRQGQAMVAAGADLLDVGGESTRPGSRPVDEAVELARAVPAVELLARGLEAPISIDTRRRAVAEAAVNAGATLINDVSALVDDPGLAEVAAREGLPLVLSHWTRGEKPKNASEIVERVIRDLEQSAELAISRGVQPDQLILDPGIGFGKVAEESLEVLRRLPELKAALPYPLLIGPSRKSFIGAVLDLPVEERLEGTLSALALGIAGGADIVRVHDVKAAVRAVRVADAILRGWKTGDT